MKVNLRILIKTIEHRIADGEKFDDILQSYPRLTDEEKETIKEQHIIIT